MISMYEAWTQMWAWLRYDTNTLIQQLTKTRTLVHRG